jgi:hypothetical protein
MEMRINKTYKSSDGYFLAKRQMQDALDYRIDIIIEEKEKLLDKPGSMDNERQLSKLNGQIEAMEFFRNYVRNGMLWDTRNDKKEPPA